MSKTNFSKDEPPKVTETNSDYPSLPLSHLRYCMTKTNIKITKFDYTGRIVSYRDPMANHIESTPIAQKKKVDLSMIGDLKDDEAMAISKAISSLQATFIERNKISEAMKDWPPEKKSEFINKKLDDLSKSVDEIEDILPQINPIISSKEKAKLPPTPEDLSPQITECGFGEIEGRTIFNVTTDVQTIGTTLPFDSAETF